MTILHISGATSWRGGEQQLMYLFEELKGLQIKQYVLCPHGSAFHKKLSTVAPKALLTYKKRFSLNILTAIKIKHICKTLNIDIIHIHDAHAHTAAFISASLFGNKTPLIISRRVDFPIGRSFLSKRKYNHSTIAAILCVSEAIKQIILTDIKRKELLKVIHSGIDLNRFPFSAPTGVLRQELNIPNSIKIIGNTSAIAPHKDYFTFVDTAKILLEKRNDLHFVIIGTGPLEDEIKNYINKCGIKDNFTLTGFRSNIFELLPDFDVFLMTSKTEGLGTSILDAFACRVPVVATNAGGIAEMVTHEKTGLLAPVGNKDILSAHVIKILDDAQLRQALNENAIFKLGAFDKSQTASHTLAVYQEVLNKKTS